jgi:hypothetical protein
LIQCCGIQGDAISLEFATVAHQLPLKPFTMKKLRVLISGWPNAQSCPFAHRNIEISACHSKATSDLKGQYFRGLM